MLVFSKARLVFLSVPKTGTTAYHSALAPYASMTVSAPPELKHSPVFRYNRFFRPALEKFIGEPLDVIAVMREPLDWLGSWYRYRRRPEMAGHENSTRNISFDAFVQAYMNGKTPGFANVGSQAKFLEPQRNGCAATHLFRYDDTPALKAYLHQKLGIEITTKRENCSPAMELTLSDQTRRKFCIKCPAEIALWESIEEGGKYQPPPSL